MSRPAATGDGPDAAKPEFASLPGDMLAQIALFAGAEAVAAAACTCPAWRDATAADAVWRALCQACWADKEHIDFDHVAAHGLVDGLASVSGPLVGGGTTRAAAPGGGGKRVRLEDGSARSVSPPEAAPEAAERAPVWRGRYVAALKDSRRVVITPRELTHMTWAFRMRPPGEADEPNDPPPDDVDAVHDFPSYAPDGMYSSSLFEDPMPWSLVPGTEYGVASEEPDHVKVGEYPPLIVARTEEWGWTMRNIWVTFHSLDADRDEILRELLAAQPGGAAAGEAGSGDSGGAGVGGRGVGGAGAGAGGAGGGGDAADTTSSG